MKAVGSGGPDGENDGEENADMFGDNDVAAESPESAKAEEGRPNPRVSRAVAVGGGPLGGAGAGAGARGGDLLTPPGTLPVGGGGPFGPGAENLGWNEIALGGGGGARSDGMRGPAKR